MALGVSELWIKSLLTELKLDRGAPLRLLSDSQAALSIANNSVQHDRNKHIEIARFFIKQKLENGILKLDYVRSKEQVANGLTKGLSSLSHSKLCNKMGMIDIYRPS